MNNNWKSIDLNVLQYKIFKLQCKIFAISQSKRNLYRLRYLQQYMLNNLAIRFFILYLSNNMLKFIRSNLTFYKLSSLGYWKLSQKVDLSTKYFIPLKVKKKRVEMMFLVTIQEKAKQALILLVVEPMWESKYSDNVRFVLCISLH